MSMNPLINGTPGTKNKGLVAMAILALQSKKIEIDAIAEAINETKPITI